MKNLKKIGDYEQFIKEKGVNETSLDIKEGEELWTVKIDKESYFDVEDHKDALILSKLVTIEQMLKKLKK